MDVETVVTAELRLDGLSDGAAREVLRRAAREARHGPVWLVNAAGRRLGAIVTPDDAETLLHLAGPGDGN